MSDETSKQGVSASHDGVISVVAEELHLTKQQVATGRVRVRTETHVVEEIARADLTSGIPPPRAVLRGVIWVAENSAYGQPYDQCVGAA